MWHTPNYRQGIWTTRISRTVPSKYSIQRGMIDVQTLQVFKIFHISECYILTGNSEVYLTFSQSFGFFCLFIWYRFKLVRVDKNWENDDEPPGYLVCNWYFAELPNWLHSSWNNNHEPQEDCQVSVGDYFRNCSLVHVESISSDLLHFHHK